MRNQKKVAAGLIALAVAASVTWADEIVRGGGAVTNLNDGAAWVGGVAPDADDVAVFTNGSSNGTFSASTEWMGIKVDQMTSNRSITLGGNTLTLGSSGINMATANFDLSLSTGGNVALGANQTWTVPGGRLLTSGGVLMGSSTITKEGAGTLHMNTNLSTFTGGINMNGGVITSNSNTVVAADGTITSGSFGKGTITFASGTTISSNGASNRDFANNVVLNGDITIGLTGNTGRVRAAGTWDLGGQTRTVTLTNPSTALATGEQLSFGNLGGTSSVGGRTFHLTNGTLRLVAGPTATAANPALAVFAVGQGGSFFDGNSGLTIGTNVRMIENSNQTQSGNASPKLTVESGGEMFLTNGTESKNLTVYSLAGNGLVSGTPTNLNQTVSTLTIDGGEGMLAVFAGTILDNTGTVGGATVQNGQVRVTKSGAGTQIFSNFVFHTGPTNVNAGILQIDGLMGTSATTVSASGVLAGNGTIGGSVTLSGTGSISPGGNSSGGASIGTLTVSNAVTLADGTFSNFDILSTTGGSDRLAGVTALTFGGTLNVTNLGDPGAFVAGQVFDLFDFVAAGSTFSAINLPVLPVGLGWKVFGSAPFDYATGRIEVEAATVVPEPAGVVGMMVPAVMLLRRRR